MVSEVRRIVMWCKRNLRSTPGLLALLVLFLSALACDLPIGIPGVPTSPPEPTVYVPTTPPEPTTEPQPTNTPTPDVIYQGTSFSYDASLAANVRAETVPMEEDQYDMPWLPVPEHVEFVFEGYILPETFHEPRIYVYPVGEFEVSNPDAAQVIAGLRQFLADRPAAAPSGIPFLPMFNAGQMLRSHIGYIDFQDGTGVRFLTQYSQAAIPINNDELFYTFQGLTHNGEYYVAAILPVSNAILPPDGSIIPGGDPEGFASNFESYLQDMKQQLDAQPPSSFAPELSLLDAVIQSLHVE
jgi:hypothetical protein